MKKLILAILLIAGSIATTANATEIKGVTVGGDFPEFSQKLIAAGFKLVDVQKLTGIYEGTYASREVEIYASYTPVTKKVFKVAIYFKEHEDWYNLESDYFNLQTLLTNKFGEFEQEFQLFLYPFDDNHQGVEMTAVAGGKCGYATFWTMETAPICLSISEYKSVRLIIENIANMELYQAETKNAAMEDM